MSLRSSLAWCALAAIAGYAVSGQGAGTEVSSEVVSLTLSSLRKAASGNLVSPADYRQVKQGARELLITHEQASSQAPVVLEGD